MPHTPGPWIVDAGFVMAADGGYICDPHCNGGPDDHAERDANASLVAAAPDLLAACKRSLGAYDMLALCGAAKHLPGYEHTLAALKAAIAKAEPDEPVVSGMIEVVDGE